MIETIQTTNHILAIGGIGLFLGATVLIIDLYSSKTFVPLINRFGLWLAFLVTLTASALTLVYSEIFGFVPCGLCWFQRVFLFSQVFILATALYYRDLLTPRHGIVLSVAGLVFSLYQHYLQMGGNEFVKCPLSGGDCVKRYFFEFGFITFPLLSAFAFIFLIALYLYMLKTRTV